MIFTMCSVVAECDDDVVVMVDGNKYFPLDSRKEEYFTESSKTSVCGWKGTANYFTISVDGSTNKDACWYYAEPKDAAKQIKGYMAFWKGVEVK